MSAAAQFAAGNLAVLRLGDGQQTLVNSGNSIFVDQFTTNGTLVNSTSIPDAGTGALLLGGSATSEGGLTRSLDGRLLSFLAYHTNRGALSTALSGSTGKTVPRALVTVDASGAVEIRQTSTTLFTGSSPRAVVTDGTNRFWTAGGSQGTQFLQPSGPLSVIQSTIINTRDIRIFGGKLCFSTQSGEIGIYYLDGLPVTVSATNLLFATGTNSQPAAFALNTDWNLAYVADQRSAANGGGIQKWTNSASGWQLSYLFKLGTTGAFGLAVDFSQAVPVLYATTAESSDNRLIRIADTGADAVVQKLASAGTNRWFRGVEFAPRIAADQSVTLTVSKSPEGFVLSWPDSSLVWSVQQSSEISGKAWESLSVSITTSNGLNSLSIPSSDALRFFRLVR